MHSQNLRAANGAEKSCLLASVERNGWEVERRSPSSLTLSLRHIPFIPIYKRVRNVPTHPLYASLLTHSRVVVACHIAVLLFDCDFLTGYDLLLPSLYPESPASRNSLYS